MLGIDKKELKLTLILAFPIIFSQLGQMFMGVIDTIMIGRVGATPLAGSAISTSIFGLFLIFGFGLSSSVSAFVAHAFGAGEKSECGEILKHGLVINLFAGLVMAGIMELGSNYFHLLGQPPEVTAQAQTFFPILGWSIVPLMVFQAFRQFMEGLSETIIPMIIMVCGILVNVFLNYLWIYGNWGWQAYGLEGAGYATLCARIFMLCLGIAYVLTHSRFKPYLPLHRFGKLNAARFKKIFKQGLFSGFQFLFEVGAFTGAAVMMGWFGAKTLAGHQIAINLAALTYMVTLGISFATSIRIAQAMGKKQFHTARKIGFTSIHAATAIMGIFAILFVVGKYTLASIYIQDEEVIEIAVRLILIGAVFQVFDGIQGVAVGALRGLLDVRIPTVITFFAYWVFSLPAAYYLGFKTEFGAPGIWIALTLGLAIAAVGLTLRFAFVTSDLRAKN